MTDLVITTTTTTAIKITTVTQMELQRLFALNWKRFFKLGLIGREN
jgi:hypothetical protein